MGMRTTAKVFRTGRSQAVRLPAPFRFAGDEVYIRRDPQTGDVILSAKPGNWDNFFAAVDAAAGEADDFMTHARSAAAERGQVL
jgi:antitoxin VapB